MLAWLKSLANGGHHIFKTAVTRFHSRVEVAEYFHTSLGSLRDIQMCEFLIQMIMRKIESATHEPFYEVVKVDGGHGSVALLECLLDEYWQSMRDAGRDFPTKKEEQLKSIAGWLADTMNEEAYQHLFLTKKTMRSRRRKCLNWTCWVWNGVLNCHAWYTNMSLGGNRCK